MALIDDIANRANVTPMTVYNVLNGRNKEIRPSAMRRAERIRQIAAELGYRPNAAARAMVKGRFGAVAMLTRDTIGLVQFNLTKGAERALASQGLSMTYATVLEESLSNPNLTPKLLRELCVDGLLVHQAHNISEDLQQMIAALGVPVVWINTHGTYDCVYPDDAQAASRATARAIELGHRRIAFAMRTGHRMHYSAQERQEGYCRAMAQAGLLAAVVGVSPTATGFDAQVGFWTQTLAAQPGVTTWIMPSDMEITPLIVAAERLGRRVPHEVSLITFRDALTDQLVGPSVSTLYVPMERVGAQAAEMLLAKITGAADRIPSRAVAFGPMEEHTLWPAPREGRQTP